MEHTEFERLAHILRSRAKQIGLSFFKEEEAAEDVAQETIISLWKAWGTLSSPLEAERLAIRIAKHECVNVWRREQRRPHSPLTTSHEVTHLIHHSPPVTKSHFPLRRKARRSRKANSKLPYTMPHKRSDAPNNGSGGCLPKPRWTHVK